MTHEIKHICQKEHPPTLIGAHGCAWELDIEKEAARLGKTDKEHASVCNWVVYAPWAHPLWAYYLICGLHLRPLPGFDLPQIYLENATHEMVVIALSPDEPPDLHAPQRTALFPTNFAAQWIPNCRRNPVDQDRMANEKIRGCVEEILAGTLSPDTDFIREWVKRFNDSMLKR